MRLLSLQALQLELRMDFGFRCRNEFPYIQYCRDVVWGWLSEWLSESPVSLVWGSEATAESCSHHKLTSASWPGFQLCLLPAGR